jgi:AmmeMemoRadiSam system protein B/AmmeMemoRadiSam system protein A
MSSTASTAAASHPEKASAPRFELSAEQQRLIRHAAQDFVTGDILRQPIRLADPTLAGSADTAVMGAYVTLKRSGHLRACCGNLGDPRRLIDALRQAAFRTATEDHRLPPISPTELPYLDLDVNLLFGFERVSARGEDRIEAVQVGRHGLRIHRGESAGLLLPIVATENGWDSETFLRQVCRKAGLPTTAWRDDDVQLFSFESIEFGGPVDASRLPAGLDQPSGRFSRQELNQLAAHASQNIVAIIQGATPNYFLMGIQDGTVEGLVISIHGASHGEPLHFSQISFRPGLPLQTTLFRMCETAAQTLRPRWRPDSNWRIGVTVLHDPAMHGNARQPDIRGMAPQSRACILIEGDKTSCVFSPHRTAEDVLAAVLDGVDLLNPLSAGVFSAEAASTENELHYRAVPRAHNDSAPRLPAVAGKFYPASSAELAAMTDAMLSASERRPERWRAVMVPHAGLRFSGRLAAEVFNRVEFPEFVIVIGPKHTRLGADWAVSPHASWSIPGASLPADPAVASALVAAIPGLRLDAAAHRNEHAIEVELPFLAKLAPESRVVGIVIGGGSLERCRDFATGLAGFVRSLPAPPLLVISSDMNHFATDTENRALDEIALQAMASCDPAHLLTTVQEHNISMCGVLPAVIVMETLRQLGGLNTTERVNYATSADVTGDTSRVVGYAGMLLK